MELKLGYYKTRNGTEVKIVKEIVYNTDTGASYFKGFANLGHKIQESTWGDEGYFYDAATPDRYDLVEYIGETNESEMNLTSYYDISGTFIKIKDEKIEPMESSDGGLGDFKLIKDNNKTLTLKLTSDILSNLGSIEIVVNDKVLMTISSKTLIGELNEV